MEQEQVQIQTDDGVTIIGNFFNGGYPDAPAVLLLHMMPATKESWNMFVKKLNATGFHALAIDLRGHGESTKKIKNQKSKIGDDDYDYELLDYKRFTDEDHQASRFDVEAARHWLLQKGVLPERILVGGASIGANLTLQYLAEHRESSAGFLLSPGRNYRGIETELLMMRLHEVQRIFLAAARDDEYSLETVRALHSIGRAQKTLRIFEEGGHGTTLFETHQELMDEIIDWLRASFSA